MGTTNEFDWDSLEPASKPVHYKGKQYLLVEASEGASVKYRNASLTAGVFQDGKMVGVKALAEIEPTLVADCLVTTDKDGNPKYDPTGSPVTVPVSTVNQWPSRIVKPMFEWVKEVSDLDGRVTVADLDRRIAALEARREALAAAEGESGPKGSPDSTTGTSS